MFKVTINALDNLAPMAEPRLDVGVFPKDTTKEELIEIFSQAGEIRVVEIYPDSELDICQASVYYTNPSNGMPVNVHLT